MRVRIKGSWWPCSRAGELVIGIQEKAGGFEALRIGCRTQADVPERRVDLAGLPVDGSALAQQAANRFHLGASRGSG
jgi:hypothetical protein